MKVTASVNFFFVGRAHTVRLGDDITLVGDFGSITGPLTGVLGNSALLIGEGAGKEQVAVSRVTALRVNGETYTDKETK